MKRTFDLVAGRMCTRAQEDRPVLPGDVFWDDPLTSTVRYESDFVPFKPATDVVLNGEVHAPGGTAVRSCTATLQVGERRKSILVTGDRVARFVPNGTPVFTDPAPFTTMPLRYERAYGGTDVFSDLKTPYPYPRNPLGRGFAVRNVQKAVDNLALPNLEDPRAPLTPAGLCLQDYRAWEQRPMPAGFGWFPKTWLPRAQLAGIMPGDRAVEQEMRQAYANLLPQDQRGPYLKHGIRDMDFRFFNGAPDPFVLPYLQGGEMIGTENLSAEGRMYFQLPAERPRIGLDIGEGVQEPQVVLQTVMIRMDEGQIDLVWRGASPYRGPDWLPQMKKLEIHIT